MRTAWLIDHKGHDVLICKGQIIAKCFTKKANFLTKNILRKEVIQPQVPLGLPCYDFTPVAEPTVVRCPLERLAHGLRVDPTPMV